MADLDGFEIRLDAHVVLSNDGSDAQACRLDFGLAAICCIREGGAQ
ncbi:hypothetical protein L0A91_14310 [Ornithinimicrobium sp. INDO-MA30-4]|nr:hypothetical protein [Ornithinimicrobium sp. INDO-MA30-4]UJH70297.1 hypothetical protein L0A91_14310 [Ornithinimicrobium sp. INDO-MA30-4]